MTRSLRLRVYPYVLITLLRFAFASAPHCLLNLARKDNSPVHSTKGTPSHFNVLWLVVSIRFQDLFHSAPAVLFIFPSWYWFTIGHIGVFSLTGWSRLLPSGFHVPRRTQDTTRLFKNFIYRACTFCDWAFNLIRLSLLIPYCGPTTPALCWFGLFQFRSPLLSESLLFSSPPGTKMFQFPGFSPHKLCIGLWVIHRFLCIGLPHSDTPGSLPVYDSPRRFAVCCVLLLLYMPRHPPYALIRLITCLRLYENC